MPALLEQSNPTAPVMPKDVSTPATFAPAPKYTDAAVLSIVCQDFERYQAWLDDKKWVLHWNESAILYQSPRTFAQYENSSVSKSNISRFDVAKAVNSLAPAISGAIFSDATPFEIRPRPNVDQNTARAWKALIEVLLELCCFKQELTYGIEGMTNQGTVIFKAGWETYTEIKRHYKRKASPIKIHLPLGGPPIEAYTAESEEFEVVEEEVIRNRPFFEKKELGTVFWNPKWNAPNQMWRAGTVIEETWLNYDDLKKLRQNPEYDIPDDETLRFMFMNDTEQVESQNVVDQSLTSNPTIHQAERQNAETSEDPLLKPMQLLEWWDDDQVRVVLQKKCVIRNDKHELPCLPYFSANFWNIENAAAGLGVGRIAGSQQRQSQGVVNAALDIIAYAVQPETIIARGANIPTQEHRRRLGGIRVVDGNDATKAVMLVPQPQVPPDAWRALQNAEMTADATTGADQAAVQGSLPGRGSSVGRSGTGAGMLQAASQGRIQAPVERVIDGVMLPFLKFLWSMVKERMPVKEIREILGDKMAADIQIDLDDFFNADIKFDTMAGTRLAARTQMAQALPFLLEVFGNQALVGQMGQTGWKVDVMEMTSMVMDVSQWKNQRNLVVPMTPEEKQSMAMNNPAVVKAQADSAMMDKKHQNDMELEDRKGQIRIAAKSVDSAGKKLIESPLERASSFAQRVADERAIQGSQFYGSSPGG
jgi:hypothetical protein